MSHDTKQVQNNKTGHVFFSFGGKLSLLWFNLSNFPSSPPHLCSSFTSLPEFPTECCRPAAATNSERQNGASGGIRALQHREMCYICKGGIKAALTSGPAAGRLLRPGVRKRRSRVEGLVAEQQLQVAAAYSQRLKRLTTPPPSGQATILHQR